MDSWLNGWISGIMDEWIEGRRYGEVGGCSEFLVLSYVCIHQTAHTRANAGMAYRVVLL